MDREVTLVEKETIVFVSWFDAMSSSDWIEKEDCIPELAKIHSAGILISENENIITICLNVDKSNDRLSCVMNIPKAWIIQRNNIEI